VCGNEGKYICEKCIAKVTIPQPICPYCKHPSIDGATHINCATKLGIDGLTALWCYEGIVRKAILALKYKYATTIGNELIEYFIEALKMKVLPNVQFFAPIPIFWYKENVRGFNQSVEIGRAVASRMGCKFTPDLLFKTKHTIPQAELSRKKRLKNLQGVFSVNPDHKSLIADVKSVLLFDDVFTTGSTMMEAGKVLKRAGVGKVWGLTVAR